jgi:hypothetical protein
LISPRFNFDKWSHAYGFVCPQNDPNFYGG